MAISTTHRAGASTNACETNPGTLVTDTVVFNVEGGPIQILSLHAECITDNDGTASTLRWRSDPTVGTAQTIAAASTSLANIDAGTTVALDPTTIDTAPIIALQSAGGVQLSPDVANRISVNEGEIKMFVGGGSSTGTWKHYILYAPLSSGAYVTAAF